MNGMDRLVCIWGAGGCKILYNVSLDGFFHQEYFPLFHFYAAGHKATATFVDFYPKELTAPFFS
jgi:hypothetical protein